MNGLCKLLTVCFVLPFVIAVQAGCASNDIDEETEQELR